MEARKKIQIKWNKDLINLEGIYNSVGEIKNEILNLTGIEPERQKLLFKGKNLDDQFQIHIYQVAQH